MIDVLVTTALYLHVKFRIVFCGPVAKDFCGHIFDLCNIDLSGNSQDGPVRAKASIVMISDGVD